MIKCAYGSLAASAVFLFVYACNSKPPSSDAQSSSAPASLSSATTPSTARAKAPAFELQDLDGKTVKLSDYKGKIVVLEWFNPQCPFVRNSHTKGSLVKTAKTWSDKGIVWLAINSSAEGKQGFGKEVNVEGRGKFGMDHPILLDPSGQTGKAYGATNTPHMFVVDADGNLAYRGAIDNSPDGEGDSPTGPALINYVSQAIEELQAGKPVSVPESKAYGCSVKYSG